MEFEPVAGECLGKVGNAGILDHTANLSPQLPGAVELASRSSGPQLGIRWTRPEKITEATGQSRIGERNRSSGRCVTASRNFAPAPFDQV